jgi:hypothetical protein
MGIALARLQPIAAALASKILPDPHNARKQAAAHSNMQARRPQFTMTKMWVMTRRMMSP